MSTNTPPVPPSGFGPIKPVKLKGLAGEFDRCLFTTLTHAVDFSRTVKPDMQVPFVSTFSAVNFATWLFDKLDSGVPLAELRTALDRAGVNIGYVRKSRFAPPGQKPTDQ